MFSKLLVAGSALVAFGGDTDTTEVTAAMVTVVLNTPTADSVCLSYVGLTDAVEGLGDIGADADTIDVFKDMVDAYLVIMLEGDSIRLTPEARDTFTLWLRSECTG